MRSSKRAVSSLHVSNNSPVYNLILKGLPRKECNLVFEKLQVVDFALHEVLHEAQEPIEACYFPNTMMASILTLLKDGRSLEVGLAGKEGFVGLPLVAGFKTSLNRINTQAPGNAFCISASDLRKTLSHCPALARALVRYGHEAAMELSQLAACNQLHNIDARLARWLLMCRDRVGTDALPLTQEFLSQMLGIRRASVSVAAGRLQTSGLIKYERGQVVILNEAGLEKASCECYRAIKNNHELWTREAGKA